YWEKYRIVIRRFTVGPSPGLDQLVRRGPEVESDRRNRQPVWTALGHEDPDQSPPAIPMPGGTEGPIPAEASRCVANVVASGDHSHAESPATSVPDVFEEGRDRLLFRCEVIHGHQLDRRPGKNALTAAVQQHHPAEGKQIIYRRNEPSGPGFESRPPRGVAGTGFVQDDELAGDHVSAIAGREPIEFRFRDLEPGVGHPQWSEDALLQKSPQRLPRSPGNEHAQDLCAHVVEPA